jgi:hypothetical protein
MTGVKQLHYNHDEGVCQYRNCGRPIPDGISIQICDKHLRLAYAAYLIANPGTVH